MNILDSIQSADVRAYIEHVGFQFTDRQAATILYNSGLTQYELHRKLKELARETADESLQREITERIAFDEHCLALFQQNNGECFYQVNENPPDFDDPTGNFLNVEDALLYAKEEKAPFEISKYEIVNRQREPKKPVVHVNPCLCPDAPVQELPYRGEPLAQFTYDKDGEILRYWTNEVTQEEWSAVNDWGAARFESHIIPLPNPFETGDIVRIVGGSHAGVVETSQKEWAELIAGAQKSKLPLDYIDASITVQFFDEATGLFEHDHVQPIYLEQFDFEPDDKRRAILMAASCVLTGQWDKAGLDSFSLQLWLYQRNLREKEQEHWANVQLSAIPQESGGRGFFVK